MWWVLGGNHQFSWMTLSIPKSKNIILTRFVAVLLWLHLEVNGNLFPFIFIPGTYIGASSPNKYFNAYKKLWSKFNRDGRQTLTGGFSAGTDSSAGNVWIVNAFKDFKGAFGGHQKLSSKYSKAETDKAYEEYRKNRGKTEFRRGFLRILLATY